MTGAGREVVVLVALAVWIELRPARAVFDGLFRATGRWGGAGRAMPVGAVAVGAVPRRAVAERAIPEHAIPERAVPGGRARARVAWPWLRAGPGEDVGRVITEVAARLRGGASVEEAWARSLDRAAIPAAGTVTAVGGRTTSPARGLRWDDGLDPPSGRRGSARQERAAQIAAVNAASLLAGRLGAPLADVLDRCASGIAESARAESARRIALAGPASTARLLSWLPVAGIVLGWALGADPIAVLLDGGAGSAAGLAGLALLGLGRRWTTALVSRARTSPGSVPRAARGFSAAHRGRAGR